MEKWKIAAQVVFYVVIPGIILYYRFRKKFRTLFAIGMALTSILLGFLVSQSFRESYQDAFVRLMNEDRFEEARVELKKMLQRDPAELNDINLHRMINPVMYERMKKELASYYAAEAEKIARSIDMPAALECRILHQRRVQLHNMNHAMRLCGFAETLGAPSPRWRDVMSRRIESEKELLSHLEEKCR
ncbi:MAG TPA: hypothetical protein VLM75_13190 [Spirochaetota bacterium]|nr:hypothetical protein [Spirochaetota bacterium]